jgi:adenine-specific DNA-methyltransferase
METLLAERGEVLVIEREHKRYVGAQIGIHDPRGAKVGEVGRLRNKEYLFVVTPKPLAEDVRTALTTAGCQPTLF